MLEKNEGDRPSVTEIIPLLTALKLHTINYRKLSRKSEELPSLNEACQQIKQVYSLKYIILIFDV